MLERLECSVEIVKDENDDAEGFARIFRNGDLVDLVDVYRADLFARRRRLGSRSCCFCYKRPPRYVLLHRLVRAPSSSLHAYQERGKLNRVSYAQSQTAHLQA